MTVYNGTVRCLLCTIAFGMGMDCKGVTTVVNFGPSKNIEAYIQESGRCGRGGEKGKAVILFLWQDASKCQQENEKLCKTTRWCLQKKISFAIFFLPKSRRHVNGSNI